MGDSPIVLHLHAGAAVAYSAPPSIQHPQAFSIFARVAHSFYMCCARDSTQAFAPNSKYARCAKVCANQRVIENIRLWSHTHTLHM